MNEDARPRNKNFTFPALHHSAPSLDDQFTNADRGIGTLTGDETDSEVTGDTAAVPLMVPVVSRYSALHERLKTFQTFCWPPSLCQRPQQLAEAGFYYFGESDKVICFYCGGGLQQWQKSDDPWIEHFKWFSSSCHFVRVALATDPSTVVKIQPSSSLLASDDEQEDAATNSGPQIHHTPVGRRKDLVEGEGTLCKICHDGAVQVTFVPCGHLVCCLQCSTMFWKCPVCRGPVKKLLRTFL